MRILTDSAGVEWTVFEVTRQSGVRDPRAYLPEQFGDGWLCFESSVSKRRLMPVPPRWRESSDAELERLLRAALPVNRPRSTTEERVQE